MMGLTLLAAVYAATALEQSDCPEDSVLVEERRTETATAVYVQPICVRLYAPKFRTWAYFVEAMTSVARRNEWQPSEQKRLKAALREVLLSPEPTHDSERVDAIWSAIIARQLDRGFAKAAAIGQGPHLFNSGWQSGRYADCVIFAIATAAGRPYGLVAANAAELISSASWRSDYFRASPDSVFSQGGGLNDGEAILLAEAFGRVDIIKPEAFSATLRGGRPLVIAVSGGKSDHSVVLSRTFRRSDGDWFEFIDSQGGRRSQRSYVSATELKVILRSNGIAVQAEPQTTPRLLR